MKSNKNKRISYIFIISGIAILLLIFVLIKSDYKKTDNTTLITDINEVQTKNTSNIEKVEEIPPESKNSELEIIVKIDGVRVDFGNNRPIIENQLIELPANKLFEILDINSEELEGNIAEKEYITTEDIKKYFHYIVDWDDIKKTLLITTPLVLEVGSNIPLDDKSRKIVSNKELCFHDIKGEETNPILIENYDLSSDCTNGLIIENCDNVIIRNNYIHDITYATENDPYDWHEGLAVRIINCNNIVFENNLITNNKVGIRIENCSKVKICNNTVSNCKTNAGIRLIDCTEFEILNNLVRDNGIKEFFYTENIDRSIGIWVCGNSYNGEIYQNKTINNTSDGISVTGVTYENQDWTTLAFNISIYNNFIEGNLEQGIWAIRAKNLKIFNNEIHMLKDDIGIGVGIAFEFSVFDSEIYNNRIFSREDCPSAGGITVSSNNYFHDNLLYSIFKDVTIFTVNDEGNDSREKSEKAGIEYKKSTNNIFEDNYSILL